MKIKTDNKVRAAIIGATGFTGEKLVEILLGHPKVEITYLASRTPSPVPYSSLFPKFKGKTELLCEPLNMSKAADKSEVLFLSLPHTASMEVAPYFLNKGKKVVDLSADYRIKNPAVYKKYYHSAHKDKNNLKKAVYGLSEIYKAQISKTNLVANAGCYPTSVILALFPLLKEKAVENEIVVDSKSAITGAGRKAVIEHHYTNISNNIWAYKPFIHQHTPEISGVLKEATGKEISLVFVPHVVGVDSGIYTTIYLSLKTKLGKSQIMRIYEKYYADCPFIRISDGFPKLNEVVGTNFCDIGFAVNKEGKKAVVSSSIDNLIKGAAGSAVQNMNLMLGWDETLGLSNLA